MTMKITLPAADGSLQPYTLRGPAGFAPAAPGTKLNRIAYSAAHVVADARAAIDPWLQCAIDWDATIAYRQRLWRMGLGVAEAMDTAQRGMGLDWPTSLELIGRRIDAAKDVPGAFLASGCGTDHLAPEDAKSVDDVIRAYEMQMAAIEKLGGKLIVMASRALARVAKSPADYERVYDRVLSQAKQPVVLHWLGDMFDPALAGYWGSADVGAAMNTALGIIEAHASKVDGIKISLLDKDKEIEMRRRLPAGVRMYTGDDFNYAELIAGDGVGAAATHQHSDALLGIFDAIAPAASAALAALAAGDEARFHAILAPTVPLSRHIFKAPTRFYKTGVVFMAWINGHQDHFVMVGGQQSTRSLPHLAELFRLADAAGLIEQPELAVRRMQYPARLAWRRWLNGASREAPPPALNSGCRSDARLLTGSSLAVDQYRHRAQAARRGLALARHPRRLRRTRYPRGVSMARSGGGGRAAGHGESTEGAWPGTVGLLPRRHVHLYRHRQPAGGARRQPARARRSLHPWARRAWCWWSAGCRGRSPARRRIATSPARASRSPKASPRCCKTHASGACRWRSSRCIRCLRPTGPASTRWNRHWMSATCSTPSRRQVRIVVPAARRWAWPSTSITCGGTRSCARRSSASAPTGCWLSMSATG